MIYSVAELDKILPPLRVVHARPVDIPDAISDDDQELLAQMFLADRHAAAIWAGDVGDDVDPSLTDWPLIRATLRATGLDVERAERLLWQSPRAKTRADRWAEQRRGYTSFLDYELQRAVNRWHTDETNVMNWPQLTVSTEPGPSNGHCSPHCDRHAHRITQLEHELQEARSREARRAALFRKPQTELNANAKLVANALLNLQASRESRGLDNTIPIVIATAPDPDHPEREEWTDDTLAGQVGASRATVSRALEVLTTGPAALWEREYEPNIRADGTRVGSRLKLVPRAPAAEAWERAIAFTPTAAPAKAKVPRVNRCKRHPFADVLRETTWTCTKCAHAVQTVRRSTINVCPDPPEITDPMVTGDAVPGDESPVTHFDAPVRAAPISVESVLEVTQNDAPVADLERIYGRAQHAAVDHCCHACGAFDRDTYGVVVEISPGVWLHPDCRLPLRVSA